MNNFKMILDELDFTQLGSMIDKIDMAAIKIYSAKVAAGASPSSDLADECVKAAMYLIRSLINLQKENERRLFPDHP